MDRDTKKKKQKNTSRIATKFGEATLCCTFYFDRHCVIFTDLSYFASLLFAEMSTYTSLAELQTHFFLLKSSRRKKADGGY